MGFKRCDICKAKEEINQYSKFYSAICSKGFNTETQTDDVGMIVLCPNCYANAKLKQKIENDKHA